VIRSMTGYGAVEERLERWTVRAEARTVNHSGFRISFRLPEMLRLKESELAKLARRWVSRGHLYLSIRCELSEEALELLVDRRRLRAYLAEAKKVAASEGVPLSVEAGALMSLPEVISAQSLPEEMREELWHHVQRVTEGAMEQLVEMREREGENLLPQLLGLCAGVRERTERIQAGLSACVGAYRDRLLERVERLLEGTGLAVDKEALARETAVVAEKSDISEEATRLLSHIEQFLDALRSEEGPVGRKLEFLVQEMQREANTMAAKVPSSELVQEALETKGDIQRLREQVCNVE